MKIHIFIGLVLLSVGLNGFATDTGNLIPERGVLDLTSTGIGNSLYNLNGEWEFYWEELLTPENYQVGKEAESGIFVTVPSYWNSYEVDGEKLPGQGYGTGLGLQLVSDLVEKNEGVLKIDSTTGKGSIFTFTLPGGDKRERE